MHYPSVISDYMSAVSTSIAAHESLRVAEQAMAEQHVRELPVRDHGRICGVLTERDTRCAQYARGDDTRVRDVMSSDFYLVMPNAPLAHVVKTMATHDYHCAVVVERGVARGVFTTAHALAALSELLEQQPTTREGIGPGEVRAVVLTEHLHVTHLLERARDAASAVLAPSSTDRDSRELRAATARLLTGMSSHVDLEDRALTPALAQLPGYGRERAEQLVEEHRRQTLETRQILDALEEEEQAAPVLAERLDGLLQRLAADLAHEEDLLLNADLLRDDGIVTECTAG